ncbi:MAG: DUF3783 domain-containing protein [Oscillospiraceae bacterium]
MKSRIITAKPVVLNCNLSDEQSEKLGSILEQHNVKSIIVQQCDMDKPVGFLLGFRGFSEDTEKHEDTASDEQCLVFSGIQKNQVFSIINDLKAGGLNIPLKAIATASNQKWSLNQLIEQLKAEHEYMARRKE